MHLSFEYTGQGLQVQIKWVWLFIILNQEEDTAQ